MEFELALSSVVAASKRRLLHGTRVTQDLGGHQLLLVEGWGGPRLRPGEGPTYPAFPVSHWQCWGGFGNRPVVPCGSLWFPVVPGTRLLPLHGVSLQCPCSASLSLPPSLLPFFTTSATFCFLVQMVMILLLHRPFLPNRSLCTVQVLVTDITHHPSFLITLCS